MLRLKLETDKGERQGPTRVEADSIFLSVSDPEYGSFQIGPGPDQKETQKNHTPIKTVLPGPTDAKYSVRFDS